MFGFNLMEMVAGLPGLVMALALHEYAHARAAVAMLATAPETRTDAVDGSNGAKVVLAGPSNAGKSSLFNLFLKEDRSIVSAQKGTTRDYIEAMCTVGGIPIRLYDTAGFRSFSESEIEEEGIRRSHSLVEGADIIIYMVDSSDMAFQICARMAFREAFAKAGAQILEPIMKVEIATPTEFQGNVVGNVSQRRGSITGTSEEMGTTTITAEVPLSEMFGYATDLRSMTQGKAEFTMEFAKYAPVPKNIQEELIKKYGDKAKARA